VPPKLGVPRAIDTAFRDPFDASWRERVVVLGAVLAVLLLALALGLGYARHATVELLGLLPASIFAAGKFLPLWGISGRSNFTPWELGLVIWLLDTLSVLVIVYALEGFYRLGRLKRALDRIQHNSKLVLAAYPRIRRAGGTFLGILLGIHRYALIAAVSFGGLIGGMGMAFAAVNFQSGLERLRAAQQHPVVHYAIVGGVVLLVIAGVVLVNRAYRRALQKAESGGETR